MEINDIITFVYKAMETEMIVTTRYDNITVINPKNKDLILYIYVDNTKITMEMVSNITMGSYGNMGSYNITKEEYNKFKVLIDDIRKYSKEQFEFEFSKMLKEMDFDTIDD